MQQAVLRIDPPTVQRRTHYGAQVLKEAILEAHAADQDSNRAERLKKSECKVCFYIYKGRIGGAAMTERPCGICNKVVMYGSTNTDVLCSECAKEHSLCKRCAGISTSCKT